MKKIALLLLSLQLASCYQQTETQNPSDSYDKGYLKVLHDQCENPDIIEVEISSDGYTEIEYLCEGKRYEIGIKGSQLLFREHAIEEADIPFDKIQPKLSKKYPGWFIDEFSQIEANNISFIKVEIVKEGIEQNVYFTNEGKWHKIKPMDASSSFNSKLIEKNKVYNSVKYNFETPDSIYEMPDLLREISGIAISNNNEIYCIQDEIGSIFTYNFTTRKITNSHRFTDIGDFEDIAVHNHLAYILRSDGNLFVYDLKEASLVSQTMLQTNSLNLEGLFYKDDYLYIASKEALITHSENERMVFRVPTNNLKQIEQFLEIDLADLAGFIEKNYSELKISNFIFNPSALAFHPISNELYILSATDRYIAVFKDKLLVNVIPLSAENYYKPEGLAFSKNGDLLISSEGDKKGFVKGSINILHEK